MFEISESVETVLQVSVDKKSQYPVRGMEDKCLDGITQAMSNISIIQALEQLKSLQVPSLID